MYRQEHPNPQFKRNEWINLNGEWEFEVDGGCSGRERELYKKEKFDEVINVPFCPESKLSGIERKDMMNCVWYKRRINIQKPSSDSRVFLHFGACDYKTYVYVNGRFAGEHTGGYSPFCIDITAYSVEGENELAVCAEDDVRCPWQPVGKQSTKYNSYGCYYTRTTGIWQTVWLEYVPEVYIKSVEYNCNPDNGTVFVKAEVFGDAEFTAEIFYEGKPVGAASSQNFGNTVCLTVSLSEIHLWDIGKGCLYDVKLTYGKDEVNSYFGMRSISLENGVFKLNGRPVFQKLVLDQGFYPDGIYTAPDVSWFKRDIEAAIGLGFNGARLHQKAFEQLFLYYCDKYGFLTWYEYPNWGLDYSDTRAVHGMLPEWLALVDEMKNHPSIITWCPFNETWDYENRAQDNRFIELAYRLTKLADKTRPCIDTSGNYHTVTDIFDVHDYNQDTVAFKNDYDKLMTEGILTDRFSERQHYKGEPVIISEYGGIQWSHDKLDKVWGYGTPESVEEFMDRYEKLTQAILDNDKIIGFCYTQLYDVEQENNGIYTYDRVPKFDIEVIRKINSKPAAVENKNLKGDLK